MSDPHQIHATCVAIGGQGVLLRGPSGAGKSDLAIRLLDRGADLVADDRVDLELRDGCVIAMPPERLAGRIEVRGLGILSVPQASSAPVAMAVDLVDAATPRLPETRVTDIIGVAVPWMQVRAFDASAAAKIRMALWAQPWQDPDGNDINPA
ncbi:MAG: serine/threonine protein kinase [Rhodospirillaceae bacterium]